jgi:hypothetical protein
MLGTALVAKNGNLLQSGHNPEEKHLHFEDI